LIGKGIDSIQKQLDVVASRYISIDWKR